MRRRFRNGAELAIAVAAGAFPRGMALHLLVLHDGACSPSVCVCAPEYLVEELTTETYFAGQQAQAAWVKATLS